MNNENYIKKLEKENQQLKHQLAEKDKEIVRLNKFLQAMKIREHNQDKISFAVEQLKFAQKYIQQYVNNFDDMNDCLYAIDNQIRELKGE